jgi:nicotinate-nucleotide adenylyltransferase
MELCRAAFGDLPGVEISDLDLREGRTAYTVDTVRTLRALHRDRSLFWILGSDNLHTLATWRDPHGLLAQVSLVTAPRLGYPVTRQVLQAQGLGPQEVEAILGGVLDLPPDSVSASAIRGTLLGGGTPVERDPRVLQAIRTLGLYGGPGAR